MIMPVIPFSTVIAKLNIHIILLYRYFIPMIFATAKLKLYIIQIIPII